MKKRVSFLVLVLLIAISGCGKSESSLNGQDSSEEINANGTGEDGEQTKTGAGDAADKEADMADAKQNADTPGEEQVDQTKGTVDAENALAEYALHLNGSNLDGVSFTYTKTEDVESTVAQILDLEKAGCEIIRCTVPTLEAAAAIREIKKQIHIPLVADIHFDYRMALAAIENGADKIRINPGNIGNPERVKAVVDAAKERNIPIRVGVNSGSLEKPLVEKYGGVTAEGIVESALDKVHMIEDLGYDNLVISIKSSDVLMCVKAHELLAGRTVYPLHVGITESGTVNSGNIKSAIGLSLILSQGIGDTIRVSLTGDPVEEIKSAKLILRTLGLRKGGIEVVSCPTCGRTQINLIDLATRVEKLVEDYPLDIKVAVMGCVVNGPGEAKEADLGVAGGIGEGLLIKHGEIIKKLPEDQLLPALKEELDHWS